MRKIVALACTLTLLAGCGLLKKKEEPDAGAVEVEAAAPPPTADTDAAPAPTPAAVTAKNAADVARFAAETPVTDDDLKLASVAQARTAPKTGGVVATLTPGTEVVKIAEYQGSILVAFPDPKDTSSTLMGWIGSEAFTAAAPVAKKDAGATDAGKPDAAAPAADAGAKPTTCPTGKVAVILAKDPICRSKCTKDADCKGGAAGSCANARAATGGVARVCTAE